MQAAYFRSLQGEGSVSPLAANIEERTEGLGLWFPHIKRRNAGGKRGRDRRLSSKRKQGKQNS